MWKDACTILTQRASSWLGFLRNHVLHRPIWPVNLSVVLQFSTEFTSISCRIELCFKSVFVVAINEVNKKQFIVLLRGKT